MLTPVRKFQLKFDMILIHICIILYPIYDLQFCSGVLSTLYFIHKQVGGEPFESSNALSKAISMLVSWLDLLL